MHKEIAKFFKVACTAALISSLPHSIATAGENRSTMPSELELLRKVESPTISRNSKLPLPSKNVTTAPPKKKYKEIESYTYTATEAVGAGSIKIGSSAPQRRQEQQCHDEVVLEQHCEMRQVPGILHHYEMEQHCTPFSRIHTVCK